MTKAILVIDMPNSCDECIFCNAEDFVMSDDIYGCCAATGALIKANFFTIEKPKWCPLKLMPAKKNYGSDEIKVLNCVTFSEEAYNQAKHQIEQRVNYDVKRLMAKGYNDCIDEMLGEK